MDIDKAKKLAMRLLKTGNLNQAESVFRQILTVSKDNVNALHGLGIINFKRNAYDIAKALFAKVVHLRPDYADAYNNLGIIYKQIEQPDKAILFFRKAIECKPDLIEAYINLGDLLLMQNSIREAMEWYQEALCRNPHNTAIYLHIGEILHKTEHLDEAITMYEKAILNEPDFFGFHNNLGIILQEEWQFDKAIIHFQKAIQLNSTFVESYINLGNAFQAQGNIGAAFNCFHRAIEIDPNNPYANYNLSLLLLLNGFFEEGWAKYKWRRYIQELSYLQTGFVQPLWDGSNLQGRKILLLGEQGFGDVIQFLRYIPLVAQYNTKIIVTCHKELKSLVENTDDVCAVIPYGAPLPDFDVYCPLLSLPMIFGTTLESIPSVTPYVHISSDTLQKWQKRINSDAARFRIGLVWSGNSKNRMLRYKSCHLSDFTAFAISDSITFYSLQKGEASSETRTCSVGMTLIDYTNEFMDFSDTAAVIKQLDLIISVDTAVAHLAGALGKPVWTLLSSIPDWRWLLHRDDSPWYPSMRLFRQDSFGDWQSVIIRMKEDLLKLIRTNQRVADKLFENPYYR